jgi:hypothetical protein
MGFRPDGPKSCTADQNVAFIPEAHYFIGGHVVQPPE